MLTLIIGPPDSGKSIRAEKLALERSAPDERIYLATMIPYGEEGRSRVEKHRAQREGKGFRTIETPFDADHALEQIAQPERTTVLLECLSNLVANELFERGTTVEETTACVLRQIRELQAGCRELVVVSNRFAREESYDAETLEYIRCMDAVNEAVRQLADEVEEIE